MAWPLPAVGAQGLLLHQDITAALRTKFIPKTHLDQNVPYFRLSCPSLSASLFPEPGSMGCKIHPCQSGFKTTLTHMCVQPQRVNPNNKHRVFQYKNEKSKRRTQLRRVESAYKGEEQGPAGERAGDTEVGTRKRLCELGAGSVILHSPPLRVPIQSAHLRLGDPHYTQDSSLHRSPYS